MSVRIDVEPEVFDAASAVIGQTVAYAISDAQSTLEEALSGTGAMAGNDQAGTTWASSYDSAVSATVWAMTDLGNASYQLAALLEQTGFNHGMAESHSDPTRSVPTPADRTQYGMPGTLSCSPAPPSAAGGSGSAPTGWGLIESAVGYVWPNGHQDVLRRAGSAWTACAQSLDFASYDIDEALTAVGSQTSPEVGDALTVLTDFQTHVQDVAGTCRSLATGCTEFAGYIDKCHSDVENELVSLVEWTAGIEAGGAILGFFTVGLSEAAAQAAEATRIAATASRVANIISHLIELASTVAETVANVVTKIAEIAQRLKLIIGARISKATADLVAALPLIGRDADSIATASLELSADSRTADDALYDAYKVRKTSAGKIPKSREAWQNMVDSLRRNKLVGDGYRDQVANDLGITYGEGGWQAEYTIPGSGRRLDIANPVSKTGIEVKSGTTPVDEGLAQMAKDEAAVRKGWTITWQLKTNLDPSLMARLQELAAKYPGRFTYTVAGK